MANTEELTPYNFPIHDHGALQFAVDKTRVHIAILEVNKVTLSIIKPVYNDDELLTDLNFLGVEKIFHTSLIKNCQINVLLYTEGDVPSLIVKYTEPTINWTNGERFYQEKVTVGSSSGDKDMVLVYTPSGCGYAM